MEATVPAAWTPRSAPFDGPGGSLQRLDGPGGAVGLAVRVRPDLADHPAVQRGVNEVAGFVRGPGVPGVLPLAAWDRERAVFVYEIGDGRLLSELVADCAARGIVPGERVGVELVWRVAAVLDAAARAGGPVGVFNHGGLSPWRIVVYPDGDIALLGYALPPVEVIAWLDEGTDEPPGAALRYCPPERIQDDNEDVRSDLFSLGAIAAELALGAPLLAGTAQELVEKILADEAAAAIEVLSGPVRSLLQGTLALSRADRRRTGAEVAREARMVLRSMGGRTLSALARGAWDEQVEPEIAPGMTPIRAEPRFVVIERPDKPVDPEPVEVEEPTPREWRVPAEPPGRSSAARAAEESSALDAPDLRDRRAARTLPPEPEIEAEPEAEPVEPGPESTEPTRPLEAAGRAEGSDDDDEGVLVEDGDRPDEPLPVGGTEDAGRSDEAVLVDPDGATADDPDQATADDPDQATAGDPDEVGDPAERAPRLEPLRVGSAAWTPDGGAGAAGRIVIAVPRIGSSRGVVDAADDATVLFERSRPLVDESDDTAVGPVQDWVYEMDDDPAPEPGLGLEEEATTLHDHLDEPEDAEDPEEVVDQRVDAIESADPPDGDAVPAPPPDQPGPDDEPAGEPEADPGPLPEELPTLFDRGPVARELPPDPPPPVVIAASSEDPLDPPPAPRMEVLTPAPAPKASRGKPSKPPKKAAEPPPEALRPPEIPDVLHLRGVTVDLADRQVRPDQGQFAKLNANQVAVLGYLAARPGRDVRRDEIWKHALNGQGSRNSVRGMVARLRKKIERNASKPEHLINVPGVGFRFELPDGFTAPKGSKLPEPDGPPVGREVELEQVVTSLDEAPVVSIVGPPGSGTRQLALHAAHAAVKQGREVHRCQLGAESLTAALARDLGVRRLGRTEDEIHADLAAVLVARPDLLIFIDAPSPDPTLREMVGRWLERSPEAKFLIACRGALGLPGEKCIRLEALREQAAIERFLKRAKSRPIKQLDPFGPKPPSPEEDEPEEDPSEEDAVADDAVAEDAAGLDAPGPEAARKDPGRHEAAAEAAAQESAAQDAAAGPEDEAREDIAEVGPAEEPPATPAIADVPLTPPIPEIPADPAQQQPVAEPAPAHLEPSAASAVTATSTPTSEPSEPEMDWVAPPPPGESPPPKPEDALDPAVLAAIGRLDAVERSAVAQLVVFRDGFDLGSAEAIVELGDSSRSMMTLVESLIANDLAHVVADDDSANVRWNLFDDVRTFVRRKVAPEVFEPPQQRHSATYGQLGFRLGGRPWVERTDLAILVRERENLRAALQQGGVLAAGAALGLTAILGYEQAVPLAEAVDRILADPALAPAQAAPWRAGARIASARLRKHLGIPHKASAELRAAVGDLQSHDQLLLVEVARLHTELGSTFEAEAALNRVATGDPWLLSVMAMLRGRAKAARAEPKRAERSFVEALHGFSVLQADIGRAHAQRHFAEVLGGVSRGGRAIALLRQAMEVFEEVNDLPNATLCRMRLAELLIGGGFGDEAAPHLERVLEFARDTAAQGLLALARGVLGVVRTLEHQWEEAEQLFFLALAGSAPEHKRIQSLFALHLLLRGDPDSAHEEAQGALPDPIATAVVAALERQPAPDDDEAFLLFEALEAWRAAASLSRVEAALADRSSVAVRMVLACPRQRPQRSVTPVARQGRR